MNKQYVPIRFFVGFDWAFEKATFNPSTIKQDIETTLEDLKINPIREMTKEQIRINNEMIFGEYSKQ
ncbi:hypothetical protein [Paenibacillus ihuae]|uniref:hypothetical protein n=1 Tax=Paenibacillus ihuae TaxID=1232431 RepID=UPI000B2D5255|nr:hypothetical protein [Paenibacillus ihuae]